MIAASRRNVQRAAISFASLVVAASAPGKLLEFRTAVGSAASVGAGGNATFTSVDAFAQPGAVTSAFARAFAGGFFTTQFSFSSADFLANPEGVDGVLAGLTRDPASGRWSTDWLLQARSDGGDARITDVAVTPFGIFVCGTFRSDVTFDVPPPANPITFTAPPLTPGEGFVALADPQGVWRNAFHVRAMQPRSISVDVEGSVFLTGLPDLARRYDPAGVPLWNVPAPPEILTLRHIAAAPDPGDRSLYVMGSINRDPTGGTDPDVFVLQMGKDGTPPDWTVEIGSPRGDERPGGFGIGPLGRLRVSFSSDDSRNVTVAGDPLRDLPSGSGRHSHLLFLEPDGILRGDNLLGNSLGPDGSMETTDLAIDRAGNAHVAVNFTGPFSFEGVPHSGQEDAAVVTVDAAGAAYRFTDTTGRALAAGNAVAAPHRDIQLLVGGLQGDTPEQFGSIGLPAAPEGRAFLGAVEPSAEQNAYILTGQPNDPVALIAQQITQRGGEVYRTVDLRNEGVRFVAAFLTPEQVQDLGNLTIVEDPELVPNGTVATAGWALEALNSAPTPPSSPFGYTYPETCHPAVLYLIDTAIDTSSGYFDGNPNLTFGASTLIRATGDPLVSSQFDHGTAMIGMIAGPTCGAAQGTPITVINYDIYPDGPTARLSALVEAVSLANTHKALNHLYDPAVYCAASSATDPGVKTPSLEPAVDYAVGPSVYAAVVFSAGNTSGLAEDYTPSYLGANSGVLGAGAVDASFAQVSGTRGGSAVDIWAPGEKVDTIDPAGSAITVSGTSASAALTAGAALLYLSANPTATPAALETALVTTYGQPSGVGQLLHVPAGDAPGFAGFAEWAAWHGLTDTSLTGNDDGDPWENQEEYFWGLDPNAHDFTGTLVSLSYNSSTSTLTYQFPLACALYQESTLTAHTLRDGSTLSVERSSDLQTWTDITGSITLLEVAHNGGQVTLSFDSVVTTARCFFRVSVQ